MMRLAAGATTSPTTNVATATNNAVTCHRILDIVLLVRKGVQG